MKRDILNNWVKSNRRTSWYKHLAFVKMRFQQLMQIHDKNVRSTFYVSFVQLICIDIFPDHLDK